MLDIIDSREPTGVVRIFQVIWRVRHYLHIRKGFFKEKKLLFLKGVRQGCILSPCLFNLCAEYIMRNAGLEEAQAGVKIAGRKYQ